MAIRREQVINEITGGLEELTLRQLESVALMMWQLNIFVDFIAGDCPDIVNIEFAEEFSTILSLHHSTHESPLNKKPFEYAMKQCLIAQGHSESDLNPRPGESAYDVFGNNERWSLKTEAAKSLSRNQVKIEKLSEARWVREATTPEACAAEVRVRLPRHMNGYDRILVLRAETQLDRFIYTLEEVPKKLLEQSFSTAEARMFAKAARGSREGISFGADFMHPTMGDVLFRMLLDSSVEKVRIWYKTKYCIHHGTWVVHRPAKFRDNLH